MVQMRRWNSDKSVGFWVGALVAGLLTGLVGQPAKAEQMGRKALYDQRSEPEPLVLTTAPPLALQSFVQPPEVERMMRSFVEPVCDTSSRKLQERSVNRLSTIAPGPASQAAGQASSFTNFLSLFGISLTDSESDEDKDRGLDLVADVSFILPVFGEKGPLKERSFMILLKANSEPEASALVREQITDATGTVNDDLLDALNEDLDEADDLALAASWNFISRLVGRSPNMHEPLRQRLFEDLGAAVQEEATRQLRSANVATPIAQQSLMTQVQAVTNQQIQDARLEFFESLINNQPQFLVSAEHRDRNGPVGADVSTLTVEWQQPLAPNINRFWKHAKFQEGCAISRSEDEDCVLRAFASYMKTNNRDKKAITGIRSSFSLTYQDIGRFNFSDEIEGQSIEVSSGGGSKLIFNAAIGRSFRITPQEDNAASEEPQPQILKPARVDLNLSYQDVSNDPDRQDRGRAELTFSYQFANSNPFLSLVYVTKPELLAMEDLDEELSARFGFKFSVPGS